MKQDFLLKSGLSFAESCSIVESLSNYRSSRIMSLWSKNKKNKQNKNKLKNPRKVEHPYFQCRNQNAKKKNKTFFSFLKSCVTVEKHTQTQTQTNSFAVNGKCQQFDRLKWWSGIIKKRSRPRQSHRIKWNFDRIECRIWTYFN